MKTLDKKTFYFYILQDCNKYSEGTSEDFDYLGEVKKALEHPVKWGRQSLLKDISTINEILSEHKAKYTLDNGVDVRYLQFTGEIKEISEDFYNIILEDDKRIMKRMSDKTKNLLQEFGFKLDGWHRPFKIQAKNKIYLKTALKRKLGYLPEIIFKDENNKKK